MKLVSHIFAIFVAIVLVNPLHAEENDQDSYDQAASICEQRVDPESENYTEEWDQCMEENNAYAYADEEESITE